MSIRVELNEYVEVPHVIYAKIKFPDLLKYLSNETKQRSRDTPAPSLLSYLYTNARPPSNISSQKTYPTLTPLAVAHIARV